MKTENFLLWEKTPGRCEETPCLTLYIPERIHKKGAVVIFAGGGYSMRARHEDIEYAEFLAVNGYYSFYVNYRVFPHTFPLPLLDARRAMRHVRHMADKYGYDKNKIAVMGSSAGGHLAAMLSTYYEKIPYEGIDEIDNTDFIPNAQILCYPVISLSEPIGHERSGRCLLGDNYNEMFENLSVEKLVSDKTPPAFLWHTSADETVDMQNSLLYAAALRKNGIKTELHIFPDGHHGMGLAIDADSQSRHIHQWGMLLLNWLDYMGF